MWPFHGCLYLRYKAIKCAKHKPNCRHSVLVLYGHIDMCLYVCYDTNQYVVSLYIILYHQILVVSWWW